MKKPILTLMLCALVVRATEPVPIPDQVRAIAANTPVEVRFQDGAKLRGWVGEVSDSGFVLSHEAKQQLERKDVGFREVRSVKVVKSVHPSHTTRNVLIGVAIGVVVIGGTLAAIVASGPLVY